MNGIINVYKPSGISSGKVVGKIKYILKQNNIMDRVGHLGTLDPLAEGVLPIAIGRSTRLFNYFLNKEKEYNATFIFGALSVSLDTESPIEYVNCPQFTNKDIYSVIPQNVGKILQEPPVYSAKKVEGQPAYVYARKGADISLKPSEITITKIDNVSKVGDNKFNMDIYCSAGTYIRCVGRDLAKSLGTCAVMEKLIRKKSGIFKIEDANDFNEINSLDDLSNNIISLNEILVDLDKIILSDIQLKDCLDGKLINIGEREIFNLASFINNDNVVAIGSVDNGDVKINTWLI
ncbi:MAG: tRNA pseudouridine(55) synthase TruB [Clostridia bacterium]|nr:tRNA pseudouridine(55) synthase TruB [Clostridia bacterium]